MNEFQLLVLNQGLQLVRSTDDARELAKMLIRDRGAQQLDSIEMFMALKALTFLIDREVKTAERPGFVNIFMTLGTIKGKQELAREPEWIELCQSCSQRFLDNIICLLSNILHEFKPLRSAKT